MDAIIWIAWGVQVLAQAYALLLWARGGRLGFQITFGVI